MKVLYGYRGVKDKLKNPIAAIGIFDGVHIGHKRVIRKMLNPREGEGDRVIITFDPHPRSYLKGSGAADRIMSLEHRIFIFEKMGVDAVIVIKFSDFIANMSPEDFVRKVLCGIGISKIFAGSNFHFGKGKSGDTVDFRELGRKHGISVNIVGPVRYGRREASSTWLRRLITAGNIEKASRLLRRPPSIFGTVVHGDKRGRVLGVPTANIDPHHEVIPPPGVYVVKVNVEGRLFDGVINVGFKPTFYGSKLRKRKEPEIEVHIMDFSMDLYGRSIEIFFLKKIRKERHFRNEELFKRQILRDIEKARIFLSSYRISHKIIRHTSGILR